MNIHFPCGHWHKRKFTATVNNRLLVAPMYQDGSADDNGVGIAIYNTLTGTWEYGGVALGDGYPSLGQPHTGRITSDYVAYYGDWLQTDYTYSMRLNVFSNGVEESHTDLWTYSHGVEDFNPYTCQNMMDCNNDGLIACIGYLLKVGSAATKAWVAKCSSDRGATWSAPFYFPTVEYGSYIGGNVRIDANGNIWVAFQSSKYQSAGENAFYIYESADNGATFSLIHKEELADDVPTTIFYTIDSTGQYQYLGMTYLASGSTNTTALYKSSDSGASWYATSDMTYGVDSIRHSSNQGHVVHGYYPGTNTFKVSSDSATTYSEVTPPATITDNFVDIQNHLEQIIYAECGEEFDGGSLGCLYSANNGNTWTRLNIPTTGNFNKPVFTLGWQQSVDVISA